VSTRLSIEKPEWPELPWSSWAQTCDTLHLWTQIIGKIRMALTPLVNHWWNVTFYVTAHGLTTSPIAYGKHTFEFDFNFTDHQLSISVSDGSRELIELGPKAVAAFYAEVIDRLHRLGITVHIWTMPSEIENASPFEKDWDHRYYDAFWVQRFNRVLQNSDRALKAFRAKFLGKVSPVHFFWGSFDLAVTRFSGRTAPLLKRGAPNVANWVMQEAYSHEVSSCGFWPGNGGYGKAAFYAYAYPEPTGFAKAALSIPGAYYDHELSQFILPYDAVQKSPDPDLLLIGFFQQTYEAVAEQSHWDRAALERDYVPS
jgi:hypothetical protein